MLAHYWPPADNPELVICWGNPTEEPGAKETAFGRQFSPPVRVSVTLAGVSRVSVSQMGVSEVSVSRVCVSRVGA